MIFNQLYYRIYSLIKYFFESLPDVNISIPPEVYTAISTLVKYGSYFIPIDKLAPILVIEFTLLNFTIFINFFKFFKENMKL